MKNSAPRLFAVVAAAVLGLMFLPRNLNAQGDCVVVINPCNLQCRNLRPLNQDPPPPLPTFYGICSLAGPSLPSPPAPPQPSLPPPSGTGSLYLDTNDDGYQQVTATVVEYAPYNQNMNPPFNVYPSPVNPATEPLLSTLTALSYYTDATISTNGAQIPYLIVNVDVNGDGIFNPGQYATDSNGNLILDSWGNPIWIPGEDDQLYFEPVYQNPWDGNPALPNQGFIQWNVWQKWDAGAGGWWSLNYKQIASPGAHQDPPSPFNMGVQSLQTILAGYSGLGAASPRIAGIYVAVGGVGGPDPSIGYPGDRVAGYVDAVLVGLASCNTLYDYEDKIYGNVGGRLFWDKNNDGVFNNTDVPLAGQTVQLYSGSTLVATAVTDAQGMYSFANIAAGNYTVQAPATVQVNSCTSVTTSNSTAAVTVSCGTASADFPYIKQGKGPTRTWGFWKTHLKTFAKVWAAGCENLGILSSSCGPVDLTHPTLGQLEAIFWTSPGSQSSLGQARLILAHQLIAAMANSCYLGTSTAQNGYGANLIAASVAALDGTDTSLMLNLAAQLDGYNQSGDEIPFPSGLSEGPSDPKGAKKLADWGGAYCAFK
ncbi:MAG: SdrD B-like domain-containing protein [Chthonomonadales bacterium]